MKKALFEQYHIKRFLTHCCVDLKHVFKITLELRIIIQKMNGVRFYQIAYK